MPLFTGSTHTQINGGNFYDVSGDVNIENNPHLTVQDVQLQVVPQAPPLLIQLPAPFDHSATPRPLPPLALCPDPTPTYTLPNLRDTSADSHAIEHSSSCHEPARAYEYGAENQSFGYVHVPGQQGISVGMSSLFALDHTHYEPSTTIHGGTFVSGNVNNIRRQGEIGLHILYRAVSGDAFHNSAERFPQPKCHPETRTEMLQELQNWSAQTDSSSSILWLNGPAGSGKSAIAQTFAQQLDATGRLGASFFFQRGHSSRGTARKLFPTIAYQLATLLPEYKLLVSQQVEKEPSIVDRSLSIQLQSLILGPIQHAAYSDAPQILIIDGLDECDDQTVQREILRLLGDSVRNHSTPIRICIASRPEPHIREIFDGLCLDGLCRSFNVEKSFEDVRKYLWHEFARIHREHGDTMNTISAPWPMVAVVDRLVNKSSGYFIYASTIIKFVDDKNFRPTERLDRIEKLDGTEFDSPFGALDQLYTQILTNVPRRPDLLLILHVVVHFRLHPRHIEQLLQLNPGDVRLTLRGLTSVLQVPSEQLQSPVKMHHASFGDFLNDATRSAKFYIGASQNHMDLARTVLKAIPYVHDNLVINRTGHVAWSLAFHGIHYIASTIPPLIDLLPLVRFINPDFLFFSVSSKNAAEHFLLWLKKMRPLPVDLIQLWEDYHFMSVFDAILKQNSQRPYLQLLTVPATIEDFLSQPRQLIRILYGMVLSHSFSYAGCLRIFDIHVLLDIPWDVLRTAICSMRSRRVQVVELITFLSHPVMCQDLYSKSLVSRDLARGFFRLIRGVGTAGLPGEFLSSADPEWGRYVRLSPHCQDLLDDLRDFAPSSVVTRFLSPVEFHDVLQWLKTFPEPPLEVIQCWEGYLDTARVVYAPMYPDQDISDQGLEKRWISWHTWEASRSREARRFVSRLHVATPLNLL